MTLTGLEPDVRRSQCLIADHPDVIAKVKALRDQIVERRDQDRRPDDGEVNARHGAGAGGASASSSATAPCSPMIGIDLAVARGEIHAVMGENGAGKIDPDEHPLRPAAPDAGAILLRGQPVRFRSPLDAIAHGMGMVHQAFKLFASLTVWENIVYGAEPRRGVFIDRAAARARGGGAGGALRACGRSRRDGRRAFGRRAAARRNPEGAVPRGAHPHPRRADRGADAAGTRRAVRRAAPAGRRGRSDPLRHPQARTR